MEIEIVKAGIKRLIELNYPVECNMSEYQNKLYCTIIFENSGLKLQSSIFYSYDEANFSDIGYMVDVLIENFDSKIVKIAKGNYTFTYYEAIGNFKL